VRSIRWGPPGTGADGRSVPREGFINSYREKSSWEGLELKRLINNLVLTMVPPLAFCVIKLLSWSMRIEIVNGHIYDAYLRNGSPSIFAFWHGRLLMMTAGHRGKKVAIPISRHSTSAIGPSGGPPQGEVFRPCGR
jgi:hypothetical protein